MALPFITAPAGLPPFLAAGHSIDEAELFAPVKFTTGHRRTRRLYTVPERTVNVSWRLSAAQMVVVDDWYENTLLAGDRFFAAAVQDQASTGVLWWKAKWAVYQQNALPGGYWRVTGQVRLFETGSATPPQGTDLALALSAPLTGSAMLAVPQYLTLALTAALSTSRSLGLLNFGAALLVVPPPAYKINMAFNGTNGSTTFTDTGTGASSWSGSGGAALSTSSPIAGSASLLLTANTDYVGTGYVQSTNGIGASADFSLKISVQSPTANPTGYLLSAQGTAAASDGSDTALVLYENGGAINLITGNGTDRDYRITGTSGLGTANVPCTYEVRRVGNTLSLLVNNVQAGTYDMTGKSFPAAATATWRIGKPTFSNVGLAGLVVDNFTLV
jgi:hypothetical protein